MENISTPAELSQAIMIREAEQSVLLFKVKVKFFHAYENLKPINIVESTISEIISSPYLTNNIIDSAIGLTAGYISKKAVVQESDSALRKLFGTVLQFGVTNLVAKNPKAIKSFGKFIFQQIFNKNETNYNKP